MSVLSMTGFGQACRENEVHRVTVSIRTVNHRYLDLVIRLPDALREAEASLRPLVSERLQRGRVEIRVQVDRHTPPPARVEVRREVIDLLAEVAGRLEDEGLIRGALTPGDVFALPEVVRVSVQEDAWSKEDGELLSGAATAALEQVLEGRTAEGGRLAEVLEVKLGALSELVAALESRREEVLERLGENLRARLEELLGDAELPPERLAQEVALLAERSDIREELDRLAAHVAHFRDVMRAGEPAGRRLDFLTQEILRELNTIGSKGRDAPMSEVVVEAKVICEQLREQVQNVE